MPQNAAGNRIEPLMSLPRSSHDIPLATAAHEPPLEPPGVRSRFHGLFVRPKTGLSVCGCDANGGVFVLPTTIAPAARRRATAGPSRPAPPPPTLRPPALAPPPPR